MRLAVVRIDDHATPAVLLSDGPQQWVQPVSLGDAETADPWLGWLRAGADADAITPVGQRVSLAEAQLAAPLRRPGKIIAIGLNYADHTAETGLEAPAEPLTFAKYSSSITGPHDEIRIPKSVTTDVDWEAELAVVIGARCGPSERGTRAHIAAYTVANDVSARDVQFRDGQWTRAKSMDTFCPIGPTLVTADEVSDPHGLRIYTEVNGRLMQDASTADLIFDIDFLLDYLTETTTLEPGDLILTGTPPGCGGFRTPPLFLGDGDLVECGVAGIGLLSNRVRYF
ncbi:fumarylacetoacetate hydrolase family protein [Jatrophihabitans telluris]|uniref:Fumarylacetoacetate hydrolase family protein n=1 Tax=Jatrophihabitans telluris TaxID=2038343 RepID=A0ABY4QYX8_9ACTN|nr:fumarylacetoacetate hydrolase family protein [Jatrophihabitans telluris]UQX88221.1 fumarylacetoacetate hydrolase family protein [Jatrophihabitans telluris]